MSEEQLKAFWEAIEADVGLQEKLKAANDVDAVVATAKEAGFLISPEELQKAQSVISDEELASAVGGFCCHGGLKFNNYWGDEELDEELPGV